MNKAKLKSYAPQARKDFIAAVTARANSLGLSENAGKLEVAPSKPQGDATVIAGQAWPIKVHGQRERLIVRIRNEGFARTMEAVAYTWFNRFAALRYMELHDYLGHGYRALSSFEGTLPDILTYAADLAQGGALPGLNSKLVVEMKLAGDRDGELYRLLLVAQCNALSNVMPFLFERIDDESELLLPDNLLRTDSVIAKLVATIEEDDWKEVEIIGWLYQFYISEKKDEVIGTVVKSEDIPAATQLFTPKWIVQYLVQNSVGRLWLMANPASAVKFQWKYYIAPVNQPVEVQAQLDSLIHARVNEDGGSLNPESMTLLDPACGSGHILVEAYDVFKAIYLERGYQPRSIPRLILEKNLYGLDIDDRAAQMAGFALLMRARADDRRLFNEPIKLNVLSLRESKGLDADELTRALQTVASFHIPQIAESTGISGFDGDDLFPGTSPQLNLGESSAACISDPVRAAIAGLIGTFAHAKTFGSLVQIPSPLNTQLVAIAKRLQLALQNGDLYAKAAAQDLLPLVTQAQLLEMQFDAVVANPPYMGSKGMNAILKEYAQVAFSDSKSDLFAMFIERGFEWCKPSGFNSMVTMQSWMFLPAYESLRRKILANNSLCTATQIGFNSFPELNSKVAQAVAFSIIKQGIEDCSGSYLRLVSEGLTENKDEKFLNRTSEIEYVVKQSEFSIVPGNVFAYWLSVEQIYAYKYPKLSNYCDLKTGIIAGNNEKFLRYWFEVDFKSIERNCQSTIDSKNLGGTWYPIYKGGDRRKWYGNLLEVVNFRNNGVEIRAERNSMLRNERDYFKPGLHWNRLSQGNYSARISMPGSIFEDLSPSCFPKEISTTYVLGFLNSSVGRGYEAVTSTGWKTEIGSVGNFPLNYQPSAQIDALVSEAIEISKKDWDSVEISLDFSSPFMLGEESTLLSENFSSLTERCESYVERAAVIDASIDSFFEGIYGFQKKTRPENKRQSLVLFGNAENRYGSTKSEQERQKLLRQDCVKDIVSYAIGCMMGRYSLDELGVVYANSGNVGFDATNYNKFPADADGIVPLTDQLWFEDDAASRIREFVRAVWGTDTLAENMAWLAESLGIKASETPEETIRRYLADKFYKDHLQTYKKRPIYWFFSSGKQGAFQALVYLHRYHEGTLSRMRAEYVVPLTGKIQSRIDMLEKDATAASSTAVRNKLAKEVEKLKKKHVELLAYDEQLRHHADMRITLDLDDGVKVNYSKFGNLLAEVKAVTGGASDD